MTTIECNPMQHLLDDRDLRDLRASGLASDTISKSGVYTGSGEQIRKLLRWPDSWPDPGRGLVFPYHGCQGYVQVKLHQPRSAEQFRREFEKSPGVGHALDLHEAFHKLMFGDFEDSAEEPEFIKYEKPLDCSARIYAPVNVCPNMMDAGEPLWWTEGEKKALAGCQSGLAMIAGAGIYCFHDAEARRLGRDQRKDTWVLHPDLVILGIPVADRKHVICFDSDIDGNDKIIKAATRLAAMLRSAGAEEVSIAYVPKVLR